MTPIRTTTKSLVGACVAISSVLQVPAVHDILIKAAVLHPHLAIIIGAATTIAALLHNPQVCDALHINPGPQE